MATETLLVRLAMDSTQYQAGARQAAASTNQLGRKTSKLDKQIGGLGVTARQALGGAAVLAVASSVKAFASFDDAMNESLAIMGDVSEAMREDMADAAREVGKTTRLSAEEAAESYFFLASAGLDAEQSIAAMPQVAAFAQAGMFDMATATDLATDAQATLGLTSDNAQENLENLTRVTDVLVNANTQANASVEQFATSLTQKAGGALRSVGKDLEEGIAVLSVFADQGIKGERGGTILRATLDGLSNNARNNADAFEELGVAVFNSEGDMRNMADITADIETALAGMSTEQREAALAQLGFNKRAREGILAMLGNSEAIREYEESARDAADTTQEVADNQLDSFQGKLDLVEGAVQDLQLSIGKALIPRLVELAESAVPAVDALSSLAGVLSDFQQQEPGGGGQNFFGEVWERLTGGSVPGIVSVVEAIIDADNAFGDFGETMTGDVAEGFSILAGEMNQIPDPMSDAEIAAGDFDSAIQDLDPSMRALFGSASDLADAQEDVERETINATRALEEQFNLLRGQLDPIFALQDASNRVAEAQQAIADAETPEEQQRAIADLAEANLDLRGAQIDVISAGERTREEFVKQQIELGLTREQAELLADDLETLEGFEFTPKEITITTRVSGPGSRNIGSFFGESDTRHAGGPGRAGTPYRIRPDEEIFVPSGNGEFLLNNEVLDALKGLSSSSTSTTTYHYETNIQSTGDPNTDAQLVGAIDSVRRRMETM